MLRDSCVMIGASASYRSSRPRHWRTSTAGTTSANGSLSVRATASATYDLPRPTASASSAPPWRPRMPMSRSAAGIWGGASHAGHGVLPSSASGVRSSSAREGKTPWPARLAPHQIPAAERLIGILGRHGGALLADAVGLGKSYVALAVALALSEPFALVVP